jgi:hypothetical protein
MDKASMDKASMDKASMTHMVENLRFHSRVSIKVIMMLLRGRVPVGSTLVLVVMGPTITPIVMHSALLLAMENVEAEPTTHIEAHRKRRPIIRC